MEHDLRDTSALSYFGGVGRGQLQGLVSVLVAIPVVLVDTTSPHTIPGPLPVAILVVLALVHAAFDLGAALLRLLEDRGILTIVIVDPTRPARSSRARPAARPDDPAAIEERKRLARDLHDSIKQQLYRIRLGLATAKARWTEDPAGARAAIDDSERGAAEAIAEVNALLQRLAPMPLAKAGLVEALRDQAEALGYRAGVEVHVEIGDLPPDDRLPAGAAEALFRVAQEALSNVARHARARNVWLRLCTDRDEAVVLDIADDGQGFDPATVAAGMGLANIRERIEALGGDVDFLRARHGGTQVRVAVPLVDPMTALLQDPVRELVGTLMGQAAMAAFLMAAAIVWTVAVALSLVANWALNVGAWSGGAAPLAGIAGGLGVIWASRRYYVRKMRRAEELTHSATQTAITRQQGLTLSWLVGAYGILALVSYPGEGPLTDWLSGVSSKWIAAAACAVLAGVVILWWRIYRLAVQQLAADAEGEPRQAWAKLQQYARRQQPLLIHFLFTLPYTFLMLIMLGAQLDDDPINVRWVALYGSFLVQAACLTAVRLGTRRHYKRWESVLRRRLEAARP